MHRRFKTGLAAGIIVLLLACSRGLPESTFAVPVEMVNAGDGEANIRIVIKGSLAVLASALSKGNYTALFLGKPGNEYKGDFPFFITLAPGETVDISDSTALTRIRQQHDVPTSPESSTTRWDYYDFAAAEKTYWPEGTERLQFGEYILYIRKERIVGLKVLSPFPGDPVERQIGTSPYNMMGMPFTEQQYKAVFGEPDRVVETWQ